MVLDLKKDGGVGYTILDASTGKPLDDELIFYADSDRGFYRHYIRDSTGNPYLWDRRTQKPVTPETPLRYRETAWKQVFRPIAIFRLKGNGG